MIEGCKPKSEELLFSDEHYKDYENSLSKLSAEELRSFERTREKLKLRAYSWNLWYAVCAIHGFCSDDSFNCFRAGLIMLGQATFEACLLNPDQELSRLVSAPKLSEAERFDYLAVTVYDNRYGEPEQSLLDYVMDLCRSDPSGTQVEFQTDSDFMKFLHSKYPLLCQRFKR